MRCKRSNAWRKKGQPLKRAGRASSWRWPTRGGAPQPNRSGPRLLRDRFNAVGPDGCPYQFNELASLGRCKLSFEAQERAVAIVKTEALTLAGIMARLKQEGLVPKNQANGRYALSEALKRASMSFQRTRFSLKKKEIHSGLSRHAQRSRHNGSCKPRAKSACCSGRKAASQKTRP